MAATKRSPGFWQSARKLPGRVSLRVKLITAVLALMVVAVSVISFAGVTFLSDYLLGQQDDNLISIAQSRSPGGPTQDVQNYLLTGQQRASPQGAVDWVDSSGKVTVVVQPVANAFAANQQTIPGPLLTGTTLTAGVPATVGATSGGGRWRVVSYPAEFATANRQIVTGTVVVGIDVTSVYNTLDRLVRIDLIVSGLLLLLLVIVGITVIRTSLRPLAEIEETAGAIAAGDLTRRVPERDPRTEVGRLGQSLNSMLGQIESAFRARSRSERAARQSEERMRQFVADASHELRTPLTAIRGFAEYYRQRGGADAGQAAEAAIPEAGAAAELAEALRTSQNGRGALTPADLDRIMRRVEQESERMGVLVDDMLLLARLDQRRPLDHKSVDLLALAADAVHDARMVAPGRDINLTVGADTALLVNGDEVRLRQVIANLMGNALSHTPDGTAIDVLVRSGSLTEAQEQAATADDWGDQDVLGFVFAPGQPHSPDQAGTAGQPQPAAVLEVADHGPGLTWEQAQHVYERFYRVDHARTAGGSGLGLAIVAALVQAHGGAAWVRSRPGHGATFCIALPLAPEAVEEQLEGKAAA